MREFFTIAIFKIKADIRMNKTTLNSQKEKHSTLSLRRATGLCCCLFGGLVFLSTLSLRRATVLENVLAAVREFLSTFSLRRATLELKPISNFGLISIHALLAESDIFTLNL